MTTMREDYQSWMRKEILAAIPENHNDVAERIARLSWDQNDVPAQAWRAAVAAEREACAQLCDKTADGSTEGYNASAAQGASECADAIRARGAR